MESKAGDVHTILIEFKGIMESHVGGVHYRNEFYFC